MFNKKQKIRFLEETGTTGYAEVNYKRLFDKIESFENENEKDCYDFNQSKILEFYKCLYSKSFETLYTYNSMMKKYTNWAINNNLVEDATNHYLELTDDILKSCVNSVLVKNNIVSREELLNVVNDLMNPCEKFVLLAPFEGIDGVEHQDLRFVTPSQIDKDNVVTLKSGKKVKISEELRYIIIEAADTYEYVTFQPSASHYMIKNLDPDDIYCWKRKVGKTTSDEGRSFASSINNFLRKVSKDYNMKITFRFLNESGRIHLIKQIMKEKNYDKKDIRELIIENKNEIFGRYGKPLSVKRWIDTYGEYL